MASAVASGQAGQEPQRGDAASWPCVGARGVDPSYVEITERSGGQLFLFDRTEVARSAVLLIGRQQHKQTIFRAAGQLNGEVRDFEFPVDSTVESLMISAFVQCKREIAVRGPKDVELPGAESHEYRAGRVMTFPAPQPGGWKVTISGRGVFSVLVEAKTEIELTGVRLLEPGALQAQVLGLAHEVAFHLISPWGDTIGRLGLEQMSEDGNYEGELAPNPPAFRVAVRGVDENGWSFQRVHAPLLGAVAKPANDTPDRERDGAPLRQ